MTIVSLLHAMHAHKHILKGRDISKGPLVSADMDSFPHHVKIAPARKGKAQVCSISIWVVIEITCM